MKAKQKTAVTLQKVFIVSAAIAWVSQIVQVVAIAVMQYPSNQNLSGLVPWFLFAFGLPLVLAAVVYASKRKRELSVQNVFEVTVIATAMLFVHGAFTSLTTFVPMPWMYTSEHVWILQLITFGVPLSLTVLAFAFILVRLRRSGQW